MSGMKRILGARQGDWILTETPSGCINISNMRTDSGAYKPEELAGLRDCIEDVQVQIEEREANEDEPPPDSRGNWTTTDSHRASTSILVRGGPAVGDRWVFAAASKTKPTDADLDRWQTLLASKPASGYGCEWFSSGVCGLRWWYTVWSCAGSTGD